MALQDAILRSYQADKLAEVIRGTGAIDPGSVGQLVTILTPEVEMVEGDDGQAVLKGRGGRDLGDILASKLADPSFEKFLSREGIEARRQARQVESIKRIVAERQGGGFGPFPGQAPGLDGRYGAR